AITWSITSGSLPSGLFLNTSTGAVTGNTTVQGTNNITFQAADTNSHTATEAVTLRIGNALNTIADLQDKTSSSGTTLAFTSNITSGSLIGCGLTQDINHSFMVPRLTDTLSTPFAFIAVIDSKSSVSPGSVERNYLYAGIAPSG